MKFGNIIFIVLLSICLNASSQNYTFHAEDLYNGKIDSFSINKNQFRLKWTDSISGLIVLEKKIKAEWVRTDTIEWANNYSLRDINGDGFLDLGVPISAWNTEAYLFNPKTNLFVDCGLFERFVFEKDNLGMKINSGKESIYYDYQFYKREEWASYLFQIKDYKRIDLADVFQETQYSKQKEDLIRLDIIVSKHDKDDNQMAIEKIKNKSSKQFDYATYWKLNWRKFIRD